MNSNLVLTTILAVAFICQVKETEGIKCYLCKKCKDPFDSAKAIPGECPGSCFKGKVSDTSVVARLCFEDKKDESCETKTEDGITGEYCYCNSDLCNGGSAERLSVMLIVTIFVVMVLKAIFW